MMDDPSLSKGAAAREFRFHSGRLCLDFVATVGDRHHAKFERLRDTSDLAQWLIQAELTPETVSITDAQLQDSWALRETIYRLITAAMARRPAQRKGVHDLNDWAAYEPLIPQLTQIGKPQQWVSATPFRSSMSTIARDAVDLLTSDLITKIRECSAEDCSAIFVDVSRPGRRRWCSMATCGNRPKKERYRKRHQAAGA
ncbi:MAG: CGNR zinc finger domain-containing protein [Pseudomonadota bacterium]